MTKGISSSRQLTDRGAGANKEDGIIGENNVTGVRTGVGSSASMVVASVVQGTAATGVSTLVGEKLSQALNLKATTIKPEQLAKTICQLFDTLVLPKNRGDEAYKLFITPHEPRMVGHIYAVVHDFMEIISILLATTEGNKKNRLKVIVDAFELLGVSKAKIEGKVFQDASLVFVAVLESLGFQPEPVRQMLFEIQRKECVNPKTLDELLEISESDTPRRFKRNNFTWRELYEQQTKLQSTKLLLLQDIANILNEDFPARSIAQRSLTLGNSTIEQAKRDILQSTNHPFFEFFRQLVDLLKKRASESQIEHTATVALQRILSQIQPQDARDNKLFSQEAQEQLSVLKNTQSTILRLDKDLQEYYGYLPEQMLIVWKGCQNSDTEPTTAEHIWLQALQYKRVLPNLEQVEQTLNACLDEVVDKLPTYIRFQKALAELARSMQEYDAAHASLKTYSEEISQLKSQKVFANRSQEKGLLIDTLFIKKSRVTKALREVGSIDDTQIYAEALELLSTKK